MHYKICGRGRPLVALHGFTRDHRLMQGCLEPVFRKRGGWMRIYPDLPGMGKTLGTEGITSTDQMLGAVLQFIEKVIPGQRFVLAGESYGGYIARAVIQNKPSIVDGLLLICPLIVPERSKRKLPQLRVLLQDSRFLSTLSEGDEALFRKDHAILTPKVWKRFAKEVLPGIRAADYEFLEQIEKQGYPLSYDLDGNNEVFDKPSLLLAGRQDDTVGYSDALPLIEKYPRMTFAVIDCADHDLQIEQEKIFSTLTNDWLDRIEQFTNQQT